MAAKAWTEKGGLILARITLAGKTFHQPILGQVVTRTDIWKRLERATSEMNAVLANQKREIQVFRNTLAELAEVLGKLERYMTDYREKLSRIDINPLRCKSLRLARIMSV